MYQTGVYPIGVCLINAFLIGVCPIGACLTGVCPIGACLIDAYLIYLYLIGVF